MLFSSAFQNHIYYRIVGASLVFLMNTINMFRITTSLLEQLPLHPELKEFYEMGLRGRYVTIWNMMIQIVYTSFALTCDLSTVLNKEAMVPNKIRTYRNTLFYGLLFPVGMAISAVFWPYFLYERELILPVVADAILSPFDNFMVHGVVTMYAVFELVFIPRETKNDLYSPIKYLSWFNVLYVLTIFFTRYVDVGMWAYEILRVTEGTPWLYLVIAHPVLCCFFFYAVQWKILDAIWQKRESLLEKNL
ncbi:hypothetical protein ABMA27_010974 [Loxostege sticticalis]|uniref:Androgen-dependent TFPI-regulating protein n=1 Tax=Loxostege sticticalis TaxID=481309 RepID=A0ABR3H2V4_LOXSC